VALEKLVFFFYRRPELSREEFHRQYLDEHVPLVLEHVPTLRRYVVDLVDKPAGEVSTPQEDITAFDGAVELWFDSVDEFADKSRMYDGPEGFGAVKSHSVAMIRAVAGYRVAETVQRDYERDWPDGERSPGVKMIMPLRRAKGLTHEQFEGRWLNVHAPLALEHVPGIWRYVTNVVTEPLSPGAPEIDGIVEVHRRSAEDLKLRADPKSMEIIVADTNALLSPPSRNQVSEYIIKS
jgi:uncharacterized protein (TIGR02118 family)